MTGKLFRAKFGNYTTTGDQGGEFVNLTYTKYNGEPFDIKSGADNWCAVYLTIRRMDKLEDADLDIYTGAKGKISYVKIPYDQTLSSYEHENEENNATPGFLGGCVILALMVVIRKKLLSSN